MNKEKVLTSLAILFIFLGVFFHNGYFHIVNNYIYSNEYIPANFERDKLYFIQQKLRLKNQTIYVLIFFSLVLYLYTSHLKMQNKWLRFLFLIQFLVVLAAFFLWIIRPKAILF